MRMQLSARAGRFVPNQKKGAAAHRAARFLGPASRDSMNKTPKTAPPEQNLTPGQARRLEALRRDAPSVVRLFLRCWEGRASIDPSV